MMDHRNSGESTVILNTFTKIVLFEYNLEVSTVDTVIGNR
jgi:hypothetical protein